MFETFSSRLLLSLYNQLTVCELKSYQIFWELNAEPFGLGCSLRLLLFLFWLLYIHFFLLLLMIFCLSCLYRINVGGVWSLSIFYLHLYRKFGLVSCFEWRRLCLSIVLYLWFSLSLVGAIRLFIRIFCWFDLIAHWLLVVHVVLNFLTRCDLHPSRWFSFAIKLKSNLYKFRLIEIRVKLKG